MPRLERPTQLLPAAPVLGRVAQPPTALGEPFRVTIPSFDQRHGVEIRRWSARGHTLPAKGDEVLVVEDDDGEPWVSAWWPAAGDLNADKGVVLHGADAAAPRPEGYLSIEWVGSVEPDNAIDGDTWINTT